MRHELILILLTAIVLLIIYIILRNWKSCFYWVFKSIIQLTSVLFLFILLIYSIGILFSYLSDKSFEFGSLKLSDQPQFNQDFSKIQKYSLAARYNNPGNLRPVNSQAGFRQFPDMKSGYKALIHDLEAKISGRSKFTSGDETLEELIYIYAPPSENNSKAYVSKVALMLEVSISEPIANLDVHQLAKAIIYVEDIRLFKKIYSTSKKQLLILNAVESK